MKLFSFSSDIKDFEQIEPGKSVGKVCVLINLIKLRNNELFQPLDLEKGSDGWSLAEVIKFNIKFSIR